MEKKKRRILLGLGIIFLLFLATVLETSISGDLLKLSLADLSNDTGDNRCVPACTGKQCGNDGCGTSCGTCLGNSECNAQNQCVAIDSDVKHNICDDNEKCVEVVGVGLDECEENVDCQPTHNVCNDKGQCIIKIGEAPDECQSIMDCNIGAGGGGGGGGSDGGSSGGGANTGSNPEPIVAEPVAKTGILQNLVKASQAVAGEIKKIIETPQGSVVTKAISTMGAVVATVQAASAVALSPFDLFFVIARMFGLFFAALGLKKRVKPWGVVYDSVTKQPIDPAYVTLTDVNGKTVASAITDLDGRYGFLAVPGIYKMSANKTNYIFPSRKLAGKTEDELYNDLYFGASIEIKQSGQAILKNIPMDSLKFDWNEFAKRDKKLMKFYSKADIIFRKIFDLLFVVGFIVAIVSYFSAPYPYNLIMMIAYLVLLILRIVGIKPKAYGRVSAGITGDPLSFAILRIVIPDTNVEIAHKITDKYGRYYCLVPKGKYIIKIEKKNEDGSYALIHTSSVIDASKGIIKNNFRI